MSYVYVHPVANARDELQFRSNIYLISLGKFDLRRLQINLIYRTRKLYTITFIPNKSITKIKITKMSPRYYRNIEAGISQYSNVYTRVTSDCRCRRAADKIIWSFSQSMAREKKFDASRRAVVSSKRASLIYAKFMCVVAHENR